jgi:hypothetical protein
MSGTGLFLHGSTGSGAFLLFSRRLGKLAEPNEPPPSGDGASQRSGRPGLPPSGQPGCNPVPAARALESRVQNRTDCRGVQQLVDRSTRMSRGVRSNPTDPSDESHGPHLGSRTTMTSRPASCPVSRRSLCSTSCSSFGCLAPGIVQDESRSEEDASTYCSWVRRSTTNTFSPEAT